MKTDYPGNCHIPGLRTLWKEAFGDTDAFLDSFFEFGFSPRRCRCITRGEQVLSALYWFECSYDGQRFAYLYAVATAAACRGQGLFSALLEDTKQVLMRDGFDGILLVPETAGLSRMYEKFGFSPCTGADHAVLAAAETGVAFREVDAAAFADLRRTLLPRGGVVQEGAVLPFLAAAYRFFAGDGWLAVGQVYGGELVCQEFLGDRRAMAGLVQALGASSGTFRTAGAAPFAWLLPLHSGCKRPSYFALALD